MDGSTMENTKYICVDCGHSIPLSIAHHRLILAGDKPVPLTCNDCQRVQDQLTEELED